MSLPLVAIVGRPNVGKSTIINRIAQVRETITHEMPGVTRDRKYVDADWSGNYFTLIDTGGFEFRSGEPMIDAMVDQAKFAIKEASVVLFIVDGKQGLNPLDNEVAAILRKSKKKVLVVVNKIDDFAKSDQLVAEFYKLGLGFPHPLSAIHGLGFSDLLDEILQNIEQVKELKEDDMIKVAIVGKPNAGKSSILNKLVGDKRSVVSDVPGTTRDAIDSIVKYKGTDWRFIDTAGIRRKKTDDVEYFGLVRSLMALDRADIALVVVDAGELITEQDQRVIELAVSRGCGIILVLNKWDLVTEEKIHKLKDAAARRLAFITYVPILSVSAITGKGIKDIFTNLLEVSEQYNKRISTPALNNFVANLDVERFPTKGTKPLKVVYGTQIASRPPKFMFFVNNIKAANSNFRRFIENNIRKEFDFFGCPLWIGFRKK